MVGRWQEGKETMKDAEKAANKAMEIHYNHRLE